MTRYTWGSPDGKPISYHITVAEDGANANAFKRGEAEAPYPLLLADGTEADDFLLWNPLDSDYTTAASSLTTDANGYPPAFKGPDGVEWLYGPDGSALQASDAGGTGPGLTEVAADDITDAGDVGKNVVRAETQSAARSAIGAISSSSLTGKLDTAQTSSVGLVRDAGVTDFLWGIERPDGKIGVGLNGDGQIVVNDIPWRVGLHWYPGDPDPTTNGALNSDVVHFTVHLGVDDPRPSWVDSYPRYTVARDVEGTTGPEPTYEVEFHATSIADETALTVGAGGIDDTDVAYLFSAAAPVVEATSVPATFPTGARMIRHTAAATTPAYGFDITGSEVRISTFLRTPASWPGAFPIISVKNGVGAGTDRARVVIGSTGAPGRVQIQNSNNQSAAGNTGVLALSSDYYIDLALKLNATATLSQARCIVRSISGTELMDTGWITDDDNSVGFGSNMDRFYIGPISNITTTVYTGRVRAVTDGDLAIPV